MNRSKEAFLSPEMLVNQGIEMLPGDNLVLKTKLSESHSCIIIIYSLYAIRLNSSLQQKQTVQRRKYIIFLLIFFLNIYFSIPYCIDDAY